MKSLTPPQIKVLDHMKNSGQIINIDSSGRAFMADGTQVNQLTLRALVKKELLRPAGMDLFGNSITAYQISCEEVAA